MRSILGKAKHDLLVHTRNAKSGLPSSTSIHFLTFTNTDYMQPTRILEEAKDFGFATITAMNEHDIPDVIERHHDFIEAQRQGYGLWIWKPSVILRRLQTIAENDILVYCDAGMHLNKHGMMRYYDYLSKLNTRDMVVFLTNPATYKAQHYVKRDAIDAYFPEFANRLDPYHYAGVMIFKNTPKTRKILTEWFTLCENEHFIDHSESVAENLPSFQGSDCDNGLWNLCLAKHSDAFFAVPAQETNLYDTLGIQVYWQTTEKDWEQLRLFPFQVRRLRPSR
jgi:hypothetical protein